MIACSMWSARRRFNFFESLRKEIKEVSSMSLQSEMSIEVRCLQDLPNSMMTALLIGTEVRIRDFIFEARYPILLMSSFEMSVL